MANFSIEGDGDDDGDGDGVSEWTLLLTNSGVLLTNSGLLPANPKIEAVTVIYYFSHWESSHNKAPACAFRVLHAPLIGIRFLVANLQTILVRKLTPVYNAVSAFDEVHKIHTCSVQIISCRF